MVATCKEGEIFLWCDGREEPVDKHNDDDMAKRKNRKSESAVTARQDTGDLELSTVNFKRSMEIHTLARSYVCGPG